MSDETVIERTTVRAAPVWRQVLFGVSAGALVLLLSVSVFSGRVGPAPRETTRPLVPVAVPLWEQGMGWDCGAFFPVGERLLKSCTRHDGSADAVLSFRNDLSDGKFIVVELSAPLVPPPTPVATFAAGNAGSAGSAGKGRP